MKTKSIVLIVVSLGFGCVAAVGMVQVMAKNKGAVPRTNTRPVLVAMGDLEINDELTSENVRVEQWPAAMVPEGVVTQWEGNEGRRIAGRVVKGFPIQSNMLMAPGEYSGLNIRRGYRVYAIKASGQSNFAGLLKPGNRVDVVGIVKRANTREEVAKTFLSNIRVFAIDDETNRAVGNEEESRDTKIIQLEVTHSQAEKLALVESVGNLRLLLRSEADALSSDDEEGDTDEESLDELLGRTNSKPEPVEDEPEDGFDAGKIVSGLIDAFRSNQEPGDNRGYGQSFQGHSMTMISAEGTYVYTWSDRNMPPQMSELSGGGGGGPYMPSSYPSNSPSSTTSFGGNSQPGGDYSENSDSDTDEDVNTPDDSDASMDDDDLDW